VLPNSNPTYGAVGSVTESELLQDLEQALLKYSNEVKVWNLSLGSDEVCSLDRFSDFAVQLDNLQDRFGVTFVIAAGNYDTRRCLLIQEMRMAQTPDELPARPTACWVLRLAQSPN